MSTFKIFEDIEAWQKSRLLCQQIYTITVYPNFKDNLDLKRQMKRSAGSAMVNITKGFERGGKKEFIQFLSISKMLIGETTSQLYRAFHEDLTTNEQYDELFNQAEENSKMLEGMMTYLRKSNFGETKYKI